MDEKELEKVTGGGDVLSDVMITFETKCFGCTKFSSGCPYGTIEERYEALKSNGQAPCPEKT